MGRRLELWGRGIHDIIQCLAAVIAVLASELRPDPAMSENLTRALLRFWLRFHQVGGLSWVTGEIVQFDTAIFKPFNQLVFAVADDPCP